MLKYISAYKILVTLSTYQPLNLILILGYNIINYFDILLDNIVKDISLEISNNYKERIRLANIDINIKDIRLADIEL